MATRWSSRTTHAGPKSRDVAARSADIAGPPIAKPVLSSRARSVPAARLPAPPGRPGLDLYATGLVALGRLVLAISDRAVEVLERVDRLGTAPSAPRPASTPRSPVPRRSSNAARRRPGWPRSTPGAPPLRVPLDHLLDQGDQGLRVADIAAAFDGEGEQPSLGLWPSARGTVACRARAGASLSLSRIMVTGADLRRSLQVHVRCVDIAVELDEGMAHRIVRRLATIELGEDTEDAAAAPVLARSSAIPNRAPRYPAPLQPDEAGLELLAVIGRRSAAPPRSRP